MDFFILVMCSVFKKYISCGSHAYLCFLVLIIYFRNIFVLSLYVGVYACVHIYICILYMCLCVCFNVLVLLCVALIA